MDRRCLRCDATLGDTDRVCRSCGAVARRASTDDAPEFDSDLTVQRSDLIRQLEISDTIPDIGIAGASTVNAPTIFPSSPNEPSHEPSPVASGGDDTGFLLTDASSAEVDEVEDEPGVPIPPFRATKGPSESDDDEIEGKQVAPPPSVPSGSEAPPPLPVPAVASGFWNKFRASLDVAHGAPSPPPQLWAVIGLLGVIGAASLIWSIYWAFQVFPILSEGSSAVALGAFILVILAIPFCFGLGCMYIARRLQACDRVARIVAVILTASAAAAFLLTGSRDAVLVIVALGCLAVSGILLFDPAAKNHFTGPFALHTSEPSPVVAARVLMIIVGCCLFLVGIMFLPLAQLQGILALYGLIDVGLAVMLFWLSRRLSKGDSAARVLVTGLAILYAVVSLLAGYGQPGVILPVGLAAGVVGLLWLPASSASYFASLGRPTQPAMATTERTIESLVDAFTGRSSPQAPAPQASDIAPSLPDHEPSPPSGEPVPTGEGDEVIDQPAGWSNEAPSYEDPDDAFEPMVEMVDLTQDEGAFSSETSCESATHSDPSAEETDVLSRLPSNSLPAENTAAFASWPLLTPQSLNPRHRGDGDRTVTASLRFAQIMSLLVAIVLVLDLLLPPAYATYGSKPLWTLGFVHLEYLLFRAASEVHQYPALLWWGAISIVLALIALISAGVAAATSRRGWVKAFMVSVAGAAGTALLAALTGTPHAGAGVGTWGAALTALVGLVAGSAALLFNSERDPDIRVLNGIATAGLLALLIGGIPALQTTSSNVDVAAPGNFQPASTATVPSTNETTTTERSTVANGLVNSYTFSETEDGGYTFAGTIELGKPQPFETGITEGDLTAGSACTVTPQTDAVIPGTISLTNTSSNFNAYAGVQISWTSSAISGIEVGYSSGPQCNGESSSSFGLQSNDALSPGGSVDADLFVIVPNYYSPSYPHGDSDLLSDVDLDLVEDVDNNTNTDITPSAISGPGASESNGYSLPLDPSAHPASSSEDVGQPFQIVNGDATVYDSPTSGNQIGTLDDGTNVSVLCITQGDPIDNDTLWDKIAEPAGYVNDSSVSTNDGGGIPSC
jgi:hypothetical protein